MDICLLSKMYPPIKGGSGMYAYEIANALGERGHNVNVYTQSTGKEMDLCVHENVTVERICKARRYLVTFETLFYSLHTRKDVNFNAHDIIHGTLMPASTVALTPRTTTTPIVLTSHGTSIDETLSHKPEVPTDYLKRYFFHPTNVVMDAIAGRAADKIIGISSDTCERLTTAYRFADSKIEFVPHGVDTNRFYPRNQTRPEVSDDKLSVLFVGRLVSRKRVGLAIKALVTTESDNVELLVAGTGSHEGRLRTLARNLNVDDNVTFLGYVPDGDLPTLYSSADVFISPSSYEGFGLTFLEAMACGTPVIGTGVGGIPDVIEDGKNGYIVSSDPTEISQRIDYLRDKPAELERVSDAAFTKASSLTWNHVAEQVEDLYRSVL